MSRLNQSFSNPDRGRFSDAMPALDYIIRHAIASTVALALALACSVDPADAAEVNASGTLFDLRYDNASFLFTTGQIYNPDTFSWEPVIEQLGGFSFVGPNTVRYSLKPKEVVPGPLSTDPYIVLPGGSIQVGGSSLSNDVATDSSAFTLLPKPGQNIVGLQMLAAGSFSNPTESASLSYSETLQALGRSTGASLSLGIFSSGTLPSGSSLTFTPQGGPFEVGFNFRLDGASSDFFVNSTASVDWIDFRVTAVPVLVPATFPLTLSGLIALRAVFRRNPARKSALQ